MAQLGHTGAVHDLVVDQSDASERLLLDIPFGPGVQDDPRRFSGFTPTPRPHPEGLDAFAELCRTQRTMPVIWQGTNPFVFGTLPYDYTHVLGPNSNSCINGTPTPPTMEVDDSMRIDTPTSLHPGGVHLLLCDGAVRFISDEIDLNVWQARGSRNGHESVGEF